MNNEWLRPILKATGDAPRKGPTRRAAGDDLMDLAHIRTCAHCKLRYDWRRSPSSSLKMTYCSSLCEKAGLGFTIEAFLRAEAPARNAA